MHGDAIIAGFLHRVAVNDTTENGYRFIDRRTGKSAICSIRETVAQVFCKTVGGKDALISFL